jgi:membrane-associated phospholipid phosphatase
MDKTMRSASITGIVLIILVSASVVFIDHPLARYINENYSHAGYSRSASSLVELLFGFRFSNYFIGFFALLTGVIVYLKTWKHAVAIRFVYVGATYIATRFITDILQSIFLREGPLDLIMPAATSKEFFLYGSSFPSGYSAYFFGLFLPLLVIFPKHKWLLVVPVFVAVSRLLANDHYLGDVLASILVAVLFTWIFAKLLKVKPVM